MYHEFVGSVVNCSTGAAMLFIDEIKMKASYTI